MRKVVQVSHLVEVGMHLGLSSDSAVYSMQSNADCEESPRTTHSAAHVPPTLMATEDA